jgi:site-specific recombinase XerD
MAEITLPPRISADAELARDAFLARQPHPATRRMYAIDLRIFFDWCRQAGRDPLDLRRAHLELFMDYLTTERQNRPASVRRRLGVISQFYKLAQADELTVRNPTVMLKLPRVRQAPETIAWLEPYEVTKLAGKADLRADLHPHSLRHSSITALVDTGADLLTAMRFARHHDPKFTEHYYRRRDNYDAHGAHVLTRLLVR